jgi:hypothetical protein
MELRIRTVLSTADLPGGHKMSAVEFCDGRLGIVLDEKPDQEKIWKANELDRCIKAFLAASRSSHLVTTRLHSR